MSCTQHPVADTVKIDHTFPIAGVLPTSSPGAATVAAPIVSPVQPAHVQPSSSSAATSATPSASAPCVSPATTTCLMDRCDQHDHRGVCSKSGCPYVHVCGVATRSGECPRERSGECPWIHPCPFGAACPHLAGAVRGMSSRSRLHNSQLVDSVICLIISRPVFQEVCVNVICMYFHRVQTHCP